MRWNHETKEAITATNIHGEPYEIAYPVGVIEGNDYDYLENLLDRLMSEDEVGTEADLDWIAGMFKYGLLTCCEGRHVQDQLKSLGYEKKGGGNDAV
jgi:hypothetical protein